MFYKLEPRPKNANCPHCKSAETFISLYKESRYCNNCDRTYNRLDEIRLAYKTVAFFSFCLATFITQWNRL
jgi:transposase-like protein